MSRWIATLLLVAFSLFVSRAAEAATLTVTSTADQRAKNKPAPPGSLREALFLATAGDTIVFQVGVPIVLLTKLQVDADLTGITIQGPVEITASKKGVLDVLADGATLQGLTLTNMEVTVGKKGFETAGARLVGNTFNGVSRLALEQIDDCRIEQNTFGLGLVEVNATTNCRLTGNTFTQGTHDQIEEEDSNNLTIDANMLTGGISAETQSGHITGNTSSGGEGLRIRKSKPPFGLLRITNNTVPRMEVSRTNVEILDNTIASPPGGGTALALLRVVNTKGPGTVLVEHNTVTGGKLGIFYSENRKSVPATLRRNIVSGCSDRGIVVSEGVSVLVERNEIRNCGPGPQAAGLHISSPTGDGVVVEQNTIEDIRGIGIDVTKPGGDVVLRTNFVRASTQVGVNIQKGTGKVVAEANTVIDNGLAGIFVWAKATAAIVGGEIGGNGDAGVAVSAKALAAISQVVFHDNTGPGIDVSPPAVTENGVKKLANRDLDWPENLSFADGILEGDAVPGSRVEVFVVEVGSRTGNPENGEGAAYVTSTIAGATGHWEVPVICVPGTLLTTTATLPGDQPATAKDARTSEFSKDVTCTATPPLVDTDGDGIPNLTDPDDDNDGVADGSDAFPLDAGESVDTDTDGTGNNADLDDDGDLQTDAHETTCGSDPLNPASVAPDFDGDHVPDCVDGDTDGDGVPDLSDLYCPESPPGQIVNVYGCERSVEVPGAICHCSEELTCQMDEEGGACTTCVCAGNDGAIFECSEETTPSTVCTVRPDGTAGCNDCPFSAPGADVDCKDGECERALDGAFVCDGGPKSCEATMKPSGQKSRCPDTTGCQTVIDYAAYAAAVGDKAIVIIKKQTTDGSGDGIFGISGFNQFSGGLQEHSLQTQGGAATVIRTTVPGPGGSPFDAVEFRAPPGWTLQSVACDAPHDLIGTTGVRIRSLVPLDPVTCTFINHKIPPGEILVRLLVALVAPEGAFRSRTFGLPPGNRISIAGSNGFIVIDALTDQTPTVGNAFLSFTSLGESRAIGALVVEHPLGNGSDAIFAYGTNATTRQYFPASQDFGFIAIGPFGNITDGVHFGGDPAAAGVLWVNHSGNRVGAQVWRDFGSGELSLASSSVNALGSGSAFPGASGAIVSAFAFDTLKFGTDGQLAPDSTGWVAAVTVGQPGELWLKNPATFVNGTKIGPVGNEPRRIRCLPSTNRCVVSNFESDSLTIVQWDGLGSATILGTVPVGDGPVGIDLRADGTDVAVISTGLNDHTFTVTKIASDGSVQSNVTEPVPQGCTNPGHGLWLDGVSSTIVVTCNGSNAYAVITP